MLLPIGHVQLEFTWTVAFGSQAMGMNNFSFILKPAPNTAINDISNLITMPMLKTATLRPVKESNKN